VLETARGGILLKGVGYASNEASVLTNVSADHLDLQGIHTLPELAAAKATICRITKPDGWVVLNADDPHVAAVAGLAVARVAVFSLEPGASPVVDAHVEHGGRAYVLRRGSLIEVEGGQSRPFLDVATFPPPSAASPATTSRTRSRRRPAPGRWAPRWSRSRMAFATSVPRPTAHRDV